MARLTDLRQHGSLLSRIKFEERALLIEQSIAWVIDIAGFHLFLSRLKRLLAGSSWHEMRRCFVEVFGHVDDLHFLGASILILTV